MTPIENTPTPSNPARRPLVVHSDNTAGRPKVRATDEPKYITDMPSQRPPSSVTTRIVSAELASASEGLSTEPNTRAITPITRAEADRGIQSERMGKR